MLAVVTIGRVTFAVTYAGVPVRAGIRGPFGCVIVDVRGLLRVFVLGLAVCVLMAAHRAGVVGRLADILAIGVACLVYFGRGAVTCGSASMPVRAVIRGPLVGVAVRMTEDVEESIRVIGGVVLYVIADFFVAVPCFIRTVHFAIPIPHIDDFVIVLVVVIEEDEDLALGGELIREGLHHALVHVGEAGQIVGGHRIVVAPRSHHVGRDLHEGVLRLLAALAGAAGSGDLVIRR